MKKVVWWLMVIMAPVFAYGYGGLGVRALFVKVSGLTQWLNQLNQEFGGSDSFPSATPLWWLEGHGLGENGPVTLGGGGGTCFRSLKSDSLGLKIVGVNGSFKFGYPVFLYSFLEVQPNLDFGLNGLLFFVHSLEPGMSNFNRWFLTWGVDVYPAVKVTVRFRSGSSSWMGVYLNGGYLLPLGSQNRYGSESKPQFSAGGWSIEAGIVFGRMFPRPFRI
jgi:hypothetical protein